MRSPGLRLLVGATLLMAGCKGQAPAAAAGGLRLSLPAIAADRSILRQFTCDGANRSPAVQWSGAPAGTRSLALVLDDPDAPGGTFRHWGVFNIDVHAGQIREGAASSLFAQARNDFGDAGYGGPCPPPGNGAHRYRFHLFALDIARLDLGAAARVSDVERAMDGHVLASAMVVAPYQRN